MNTPWEVNDAIATLHPSDFIYLGDGPRQGDTLLARGHTGAVVVGLVTNQTPRLGAELVYRPTTSKTADGARIYQLVVPAGLALHSLTTDEERGR